MNRRLKLKKKLLMIIKNKLMKIKNKVIIKKTLKKIKRSVILKKIKRKKLINRFAPIKRKNKRKIRKKKMITMVEQNCLIGAVVNIIIQ